MLHLKRPLRLCGHFVYLCADRKLFCHGVSLGFRSFSGEILRTEWPGSHTFYGVYYGLIFTLCFAGAIIRVTIKMELPLSGPWLQSEHCWSENAILVLRLRVRCWNSVLL